MRIDKIEIGQMEPMSSVDSKEMDQRIKHRRTMAKEYSWEDQERADDGTFGSGSGISQPADGVSRSASDIVDRYQSGAIERSITSHDPETTRKAGDAAYLSAKKEAENIVNAEHVQRVAGIQRQQHNLEKMKSDNPDNARLSALIQNQKDKQQRLEESLPRRKEAMADRVAQKIGRIEERLERKNGDRLDAYRELIRSADSRTRSGSSARKNLTEKIINRAKREIKI